LTEDGYEASFVDTFRRVLPRYVTAVDRIGIAVTGGLDTRMIMACLPQTQTPPVCYTYAGPRGNTLDVRLGARVARSCGLDHEVVRIGPDFLADFGSYVDRTVYATDGCAGPLAAHELYLSRIARTLSPIRLTGNYGSEILRSMSTFKPLGPDRRIINPDFRVVVDETSIPKNGAHPVTEAAFREVPWHLFGILCASRSQLTSRTPYLDNDIVELAYSAPASARRSARSALRLIGESRAELATIPTDQGLMGNANPVVSLVRRLFYKAMFKLDYLHDYGLPSWLSPLDPLFRIPSSMGLLGMHKFLPYRTWFREDLVGYVSEVVTDAGTRQSPYWNRGVLPSLVEDHVRGRKNCLNEINAVITIEAVERLLVRGLSNNR
jgi:asparagine synthase (glutamine-hydrolysing)